MHACKYIREVAEMLNFKINTRFNNMYLVYE